MSEKDETEKNLSDGLQRIRGERHGELGFSPSSTNKSYMQGYTKGRADFWRKMAICESWKKAIEADGDVDGEF